MTFKRTLDPNKPVWVHRNLNSKCWSMCQYGLVVAHTQHIELTNCRFVVRPGGYKRFQNTRVRNVHAFIVGMYVSGNDCYYPAAKRVSYNPNNEPYFVADGNPVHVARQVFFRNDGAFAVGIR